MGFLSDFDLSLNNKPQPKPQPQPKPVEAPSDSITSLGNLDLDKELLDQYKRATRLLAAAEHDSEIPLSQKATALNSISTIISNITKTQTDLYNAERLKLLENTLISVLKNFPDIKEQFLEEYQIALGLAEK